MLSFNQFLTEAAKGEQGAASNSKGVAYETGLTAALHHEGKHAELHPNDEGMTAKEAYHHHSKKISPEVHKEVKDSMKPSVEALRNHLEKEHGISKKSKLNIYWTSKPGQVARTTGKDSDRTHPADIVLHDPKTKKHVGVSLKFGAKPGLRSPGYEALHHMAKVKLDTNRQEEHKKEIIKAGGKHIVGKSASERNASFREAEKDPKKAKVVADVNKKSLEHRTEIAGHLAKGFNKLQHKDHEHVVKNLLNAHKTDTPLVKMHYDTKSKKAHISDPSAEFEKMHKNVSKYKFEHKGMYIHIHAKHKDGTEHHIASIGIKNNSSPFTHTVGNVSAAGGYKKLLDKSK